MHLVGFIIKKKCYFVTVFFSWRSKQRDRERSTCSVKVNVVTGFLALFAFSIAVENRTTDMVNICAIKL